MSTASPNSHQRFVDYYDRQSQSPATIARFAAIKRNTLDLRKAMGLPVERLRVADIGCGPGAQSLMWAAEGHDVYGIDISQPLIDLARQRAQAAGLKAEFEAAGAERLPLPDASCDVVLVPELLEHLVDWKPCVDEVLRVLKPQGLVYFCTTNHLCPRQQEYQLPLYSWYPRWLKRICERKAVTTHPHWVQYTSFPAVHWFSFYELRNYLAARGVDALDRFDMMGASQGGLRAGVSKVVRSNPLFRFFGHVLTPYTLVFGHKRG